MKNKFWRLVSVVYGSHLIGQVTTHSKNFNFLKILNPKFKGLHCSVLRALRRRQIVGCASTGRGTRVCPYTSAHKKSNLISQKSNTRTALQILIMLFHLAKRANGTPERKKVGRVRVSQLMGCYFTKIWK